MGEEIELIIFILLFFFFQAEDGIRDHCVTGVQTCALPIFNLRQRLEELILREIALQKKGERGHLIFKMNALEDQQMIRLLYQASQAGVKIGRASCRESVDLGGRRIIKKKRM